MSRIHHFLLTRFNLRLWSHDKTEETIDPSQWLTRRMQLFETYCLPSVMGQTVTDFAWVLLLDAATPPTFVEQLRGCKKRFPKIHLVHVRSDSGARYAEIFSQVVAHALSARKATEGDLCLTTYLDNDDCLARDFVEQTQQRCLSLQPPCFLAFDYGLQVFTEMEHFATCIRYPNNHFVTLAERVAGTIFMPATCYGYGSHFFLESHHLARVEHTGSSDRPMWVELIHHGNIDNDVKMTLHMSFAADAGLLRERFNVAADIHPRHRLAFFCRAIGQMWRRLKKKL